MNLAMIVAAIGILILLVACWTCYVIHVLIGLGLVYLAYLMHVDYPLTSGGNGKPLDENEIAERSAKIVLDHINKGKQK